MNARDCIVSGASAVSNSFQDVLKSVVVTFSFRGVVHVCANAAVTLSALCLPRCTRSVSQLMIWRSGLSVPRLHFPWKLQRE